MVTYITCKGRFGKVCVAGQNVFDLSFRRGAAGELKDLLGIAVSPSWLVCIGYLSYHQGMSLELP